MWAGFNLQAYELPVFTVGNLKYTVISPTSTHVEVSGYESALAGEVNIPATVHFEGTDYNVTNIRDNAFNTCNTLTAVNIAEGVNDIGAYAFAYCSALTQVTLPASVARIGGEAFCGSTALTQINVNEINTAYCSENGVLFNKDKTTLLQYPAGKAETAYVVPAGVNTIEKNAFARSTALTQVTLPEGVTRVEEQAFMECQALTTVNLPNSLAYIGYSVFSGCSELTTVNLPNSLARIENSVFANCSALAQITLPESLTYIGNSAFSYCTSLTQVTIPARVDTIGDYAFSNCNALTGMTVLAIRPPLVWENTFFGIGNDMPVYVPATALGNYQAAEVWKEFANLQSFDLSEFTVNNLIYTVTSATTNTVKLTGYETAPTNVLDIPATINYAGKEYHVTGIGNNAFSNCGALTTVNIAEGVNNIGEFVFEHCDALTTVNIPASLTSIGVYTFNGCGALTHINVDEMNTAYSSENGVLFNKNKTTLLQYPAGKPETAYAVPASVTTIEEGAFFSCTALTQITLPDGLTSIGAGAFYSCTALTEMNIPEGVTSIGAEAFYSCTALTEINIPEGVTSIESGAFYSCTSLMAITLHEGVTNINYNAFSECSALAQMTVLATTPPVVEGNVFYNVNRNIPVYVPASAFTGYLTAEVWKEFNLKAISTTGLQTPAMPESIRIYNGTLHNPQQLHLTLYDMQGRQVYSGTAATVSQPAGVYVVRCNGASGKVVF